MCIRDSYYVAELRLPHVRISLSRQVNHIYSRGHEWLTSFFFWNLGWQHQWNRLERRSISPCKCISNTNTNWRKLTLILRRYIVPTMLLELTRRSRLCISHLFLRHSWQSYTVRDYSINITDLIVFWTSNFSSLARMRSFVPLRPTIKRWQFSSLNLSVRVDRNRYTLFNVG